MGIDFEYRKEKQNKHKILSSGLYHFLRNQTITADGKKKKSQKYSNEATQHIADPQAINTNGYTTNCLSQQMIYENSDKIICQQNNNTVK